MNVSFIYRILFFFFLGFAAGGGIGGYITQKVILKNLPPTTEVSIGKVKLRGQGNTIDTVMDVAVENSKELTRKEKRQLRRESK